MAKNDILVSYLITKGAGRSSGMRVTQDGRAEIKTGSEAWKQIALLDAGRLERILQALNGSEISKLPARLRAPKGMMDSPACEWQASVAGKIVRVFVAGWDDHRAEALGLSKLMDQMYQEISEAQVGDRN